MKYLLLIISSVFLIGNIHAASYTLLSSFEGSTGASGGTTESKVFALSHDGSRLAVLESNYDEKDIANNTAVISVRDTASGELLNQKTMSLDPSVTANAYLINLNFSADNTTIAIGMQPPARNLTWDYQTDDFPKESCLSYMGSNIEGLSTDGQSFSIRTAEGNRLLCKKGLATKEHSEFFDFSQIKNALNGPSESIKAEGFHSDKFVISHQYTKSTEAPNDTFSELTSLHFLKVLSFKNEFADKNLTTYIDHDSDTFYSIDKLDNTIVISAFNITDKSLSKRYRFRLIDKATAKVGAYIEDNKVIIDTPDSFFIFNADGKKVTFIEELDKRQIDNNFPKNVSTRIDNYNIGYAFKNKLSLASIDLASNKKLSEKYTSLFAEDSLVTKRFFFEHTSCDAKESHVVLLSNPTSGGILKGGIVSVSGSENTVLTCIDNTYFLYSLN